MLIKTKCFGEIDITEEKVITFEEGLMGFEEYKRYTLLYNNEDGKQSHVKWLQSMDEEKLAFPVITPLVVKEDYQPIIAENVWERLDAQTEEDIIALLTLSVPSDITKMTVNLKAPLIINSESRRGYQVIVDNQDYVVKYPIYDIIKKAKEEKGD